MVAALRKGVEEEDLASFRAAYFSKGQACLRASPLTKTHGWAVHANVDGYIALLSPDSDEFARLQQDENVKKTKGMKSKR